MGGEKPPASLKVTQCEQLHIPVLSELPDLQGEGGRVMSSDQKLRPWLVFFWGDEMLRDPVIWASVF